MGKCPLRSTVHSADIGKCVQHGCACVRLAHIYFVLHYLILFLWTLGYDRAMAPFVDDARAHCNESLFGKSGNKTRVAFDQLMLWQSVSSHQQQSRAVS